MEDILFEGEVGIYRQVDLNLLPADKSSLIPFDSDLSSLGFRLIGDLMSTALSGFLRCYIDQPCLNRVILLIGLKDSKLNIHGVFFDSDFPNGISLTTTTSSAVKDRSAQGFHRRCYEWRGVYDLYEKHRKHSEELRLKYGEIQPIGETLRSLAVSIDTATVRFA